MPQTLKSQLVDSSQQPYRFAFAGELGDTLQQQLYADSANWRLSSAFRLYYRLRALLPIKLRQALQRQRNAKLIADPQWYLPMAFMKQWCHQLEAMIGGNQDYQLLDLWPDRCSHCITLTHDVETDVGYKRVIDLADLEQKYGVRSAWYFVAAKYRVDMGLVRELQDRGHSVGVHGYNHDGKLFWSRQTFDARAIAINEKLQDWSTAGFRAPMMHRQLDWMQALDIEHDASCFDVDPLQAMPGGVGGVWPFIAGRFVELPSTMPQDHSLFVTLRQSSIDIWKAKYAMLQHFRGLVNLITHPDYFDTAAMWGYYEDLLCWMKQSPDAWWASPSEVAQWWRLRDASQVDCGEIIGPAVERGRVVALSQLRHEVRQYMERCA